MAMLQLFIIMNYSRRIIGFLRVNCIFTSDKGGGKCVCPRLSVSKITQKRVHGFG